MIIQMTPNEYSVCETLYDEGYDDAEIIAELVRLFCLDIQVVDNTERKLKAQMITGRIAS